MSNYNEDDVLDVFKEYLENNGFLVLSISGKQQGLYRFSIGNYRKGPDIVALKQNMLLVGEGKKQSGMFEKALFITTGSFSKPAQDEAMTPGKIQIDLIDGEDLINRLAEFKIGLTPVTEYEIDEKYFLQI